MSSVSLGKIFWGRGSGDPFGRFQQTARSFCFGENSNIVRTVASEKELATDRLVERQVLEPLIGLGRRIVFDFLHQASTVFGEPEP